MVLQNGADHIMATEEERGAELGKLREKITSHQVMMQVASDAPYNKSVSDGT